jgi:hypothetical protein
MGLKKSRCDVPSGTTKETFTQQVHIHLGNYFLIYKMYMCN